MVMTPEPWGEALDVIAGGAPGPGEPGDAAPAADVLAGPGARPGVSAGVNAGPGLQLIVPTPAGAVFDQAMATELAQASHLVFACGRYEGIDGRVAEYARGRMAVREVSIGDYVLAGGEPAVLVMIEAIGRLLPGVLGNAESAPDDSFGAGGGPMRGLVEGPAYTRPRTWRGLGVPDVLLSGNHAEIARWRRDEALRHTARTRPDLIAKIAPDSLDARDRQVLSEAGFAVTGNDVAH